MVYIDVPYDIEGNGGGGCFGEKKRDYHKEYYSVSQNTEASKVRSSSSKLFDELKDIAFGIDYQILDELVRVMKKINIYIWCSKKQIYPLMQYFIGEKKCMFELITWHKTNPIPTCNNKYLSDTEYCLFFRERGTQLYGSYETKSKYLVSEINTKDKKLYKHPTIKPLQLVKNHIINSTKENDVVLDCFLGSGTTAVAAKETNRKYLGFELNEEYFKIAQDRLKGITQEDKKIEEIGQMSLF